MSSVPVFKQYYASVSDMNSQQRQFYDYWLKAWQEGKPINVEGQVSYLFCYVYSVLGRIVDVSPEITHLNEGITVSLPSRPKILSKSAEEALPELIRIREAYSNEENFVACCCSWISDCFVILGRFRDAIVAYPLLSPDARSSHSTDALLSLRVLVGDRVSGRDVLTLCGPNATAFGKKYLDKTIQYIEVILEAHERETGVNILTEWVNNSRKHPYYVFTGTHYSTTVDILAYDFSLNEKVTDFVKQLTREAENTVREEAGLPKVGEGWVGEAELYYGIKAALPHLQVQHHARPEWLYNQHLDIYIPELSIALEYQGMQHEIPVEYFGGEQAFNHRQRLDARKRRRCKRNGVHLIYVYPDYKLQDIIEIIRKNKD